MCFAGTAPLSICYEVTKNSFSAFAFTVIGFFLFLLSKIVSHKNLFLFKKIILPANNQRQRKKESKDENLKLKLFLMAIIFQRIKW